MPYSFLVLTFALLWGLVQLAISVVPYVFQSLALSRLAQKRGIANYGLAWVPFANVYLLGKIADDVNYCRRNKRTHLAGALLWLMVGMLVLFTAAYLAAIRLTVVFGSIADSYDPQMRPLQTVFFLCFFALIPLITAASVINYVALYRIYYGYNQFDATAYEVLSVLFPFLIPFFLFSLRNRPLMPPDPRTFVGGVPPMGMTQPAGEGMTPPVTAENNFDPTNRKDV